MDRYKMSATTNVLRLFIPTLGKLESVLRGK